MLPRAGSGGRTRHCMGSPERPMRGGVDEVRPYSSARTSDTSDVRHLRRLAAAATRGCMPPPEACNAQASRGCHRLTGHVISELLLKGKSHECRCVSERDDAKFKSGRFLALCQPQQAYWFQGHRPESKQFPTRAAQRRCRRAGQRPVASKPHPWNDTRRRPPCARPRGLRIKPPEACWLAEHDSLCECRCRAADDNHTRERQGGSNAIPLGL